MEYESGNIVEFEVNNKRVTMELVSVAELTDSFSFRGTILTKSFTHHKNFKDIQHFVLSKDDEIRLIALDIEDIYDTDI